MGMSGSVLSNMVWYIVVIPIQNERPLCGVVVCWLHKPGEGVEVEGVEFVNIMIKIACNAN